MIVARMPSFSASRASAKPIVIATSRVRSFGTKRYLSLCHNQSKNTSKIRHFKRFCRCFFTRFLSGQKPLQKHGDLRRVNTHAAMLYRHPKEPRASRHRCRSLSCLALWRWSCHSGRPVASRRSSSRSSRAAADIAFGAGVIAKSRACRHQAVEAPAHAITAADLGILQPPLPA